MKRLVDIIKEHFWKKDKTIEASLQKDIPNTIPEWSEEDVFEQNRDWVSSHYGELLSQYKNRYIAVAQGKVIAYGRDPEKVLKIVEERPNQREVIFMYMDPIDRFYAFG